MYFQGDDVRLICPNCATQYEVADADIPVAGRIVQCGICENEWTATRPRIAEPTPANESVLSEAFPAVAVPSEIASAIADALGDQRDMQSPVDTQQDEVYATDDRLSMDLMRKRATTRAQMPRISTLRLCARFYRARCPIAPSLLRLRIRSLMISMI